MKHLHAVLTRWPLSTPANAPKCAKPSPDKVERARMAGPRAAAVSLVAAARHVRFSRGTGSSLEGHQSFAFDLNELYEERHANHAHGGSLAVLDGQLA